MTRPLTLISLVVGCVLLASCGDDAAPPRPAAPDRDTPAPTATASAAEGCETVRAPAPKADGRLPKPSLRLDPAKRYVATVRTSCGTFEIELDAKRAPRTGSSFVSLARKGFFDGGIFHRIVADFVIQGGDPTGTGTGGPGYSVTEKPPADVAYTKGVVAMAKTGAEAPGTSGSQFYVVTGDDAGLPPDYAVLGKVSKGLGVVERIGGRPVGPDERPVDPVVIRSIRIRTSEDEPG